MPLPILLIPGLATSARLYTPILPALWTRGPVAIADPVHDESVAAMAARILKDAPPRFALAGLSMGGYVAFEIMRQAPERVDRLALLDTTPYPDAPENTARREKQIKMVEDGQFDLMAQFLYGALVHPDRRDDAAFKNMVLAMMKEPGQAAFIRQQKAIITRPDSRPLLGAIACPALVLVGDADQITPPAIAAEMAAAIANARHVVVPGAGHLTPLEQPKAVIAALLDWLDG